MSALTTDGTTNEHGPSGSIYFYINQAVGGDISGTIKVNGTGAARPVYLLHKQRSALISKTWSASDGSYKFKGVPPGEYIVLGVDTEGNFNAVAQDGVTPV